MDSVAIYRGWEGLGLESLAFHSGRIVHSHCRLIKARQGSSKLCCGLLFFTLPLTLWGSWTILCRPDGIHLAIKNIPIN
jgi:hypothetical protein